MSQLRVPDRAIRAVGVKPGLGVLLGVLLGTGSVPCAGAADGITADQVVQRNVAARGGLSAWHSLQTLSMSGKMDAGSGDSRLRSARVAEGGLGASVRRQREAVAAAAAKSPSEQVQLPFVLEMKRPNLSRLEIQFAGQTAVQVYDGTNGWKMRPFLNRHDVEPFTPEEAKNEAAKTDLDGPLIDYAAKGSKVELAGNEAVDGHNAYKLKVTTKSGDVRYVWVDSKSFLDVKIEGAPRRMDGRMHRVFVVQRDFKPVQGGVVMPYELETSVEGYPKTHKILIENIALNKALADSRFAKPAPTPAAVVAAVVPASNAAAPAAAIKK